MLVLRSLHRADLLKSKLFALCDRGLDLPDCLALAPTPAEPAEAVAWLEPQDLNPHWPAHVRSTLGDLARRLGHGPLRASALFDGTASTLPDGRSGSRSRAL